MDVLQYWKKMKIQKKSALISTFLFGILAHGPMIFNKFSNRDDLRYLFTGGVTVSSGRWMLLVAEKIKNLFFQDSVYSIPTINGIASFLCIAVSLCILIDLYDIQSTSLSILAAGVMVSIPVVACMFGFMYTAHFYCLAILFAVLGAALIYRGTKWYEILTGILLAACSTGLYQAFIPTTLTVLLFCLIKGFSESVTKSDRVHMLKRCVIVGVSCVGFLAAYLLLSKFFQTVTHTELSGYKGIGDTAGTPLSTYLKRVVLAYREFFLPTRGAYYDVLPGGTRAIYLLSIALFAVFFVILLWRTARKSKESAVFCFILGALIPLAVNFEFVMTEQGNIYVMMAYGCAMYFLGFFWLFEAVRGALYRMPRKIFDAVIPCMFALVVIAFCRFDNICYMRLEMYQSQMTRFCTELITRIQSTESYRSSMKVAYIGEPMLLETDTTVPELDELNYIHVSPYFGFRQLLNTTEPWREFMKIWCEFQAWEVDNPGYFRALPEVQAMPKYPDEGSIRVIEDTLVVKFRD